MYQNTTRTRLICKHCGEDVHWSRVLDKWFCGDCRMDDVEEIEDEDV
jgi:ribosomal protein S27AE